MADGKSKRREVHAGRSRGSTIKTGHRGARRTKLDRVSQYLLTSPRKGPTARAEQSMAHTARQSDAARLKRSIKGAGGQA